MAQAASTNHDDVAPSGPSVQYFRVRYSEIDQMGTFYNARALEWFEIGRTEHLRAIGLPYTEVEAQGVMLPVIEAHLQYLGRAGYDDRLRVTTTATMSGKARVCFEVRIDHADKGARPVVAGYTIHAITDRAGRPKRPPDWFIETIERGQRLEVSQDQGTGVNDVG